MFCYLEPDDHEQVVGVLRQALLDDHGRVFCDQQFEPLHESSHRGESCCDPQHVLEVRPRGRQPAIPVRGVLRLGLQHAFARRIA